MNQLLVYDAPKGAVGREDYSVYVRQPEGDWKELFVYEVKVDMHDVRRASMVYFDMQGTVEAKIVVLNTKVEDVTIRPLSKEIKYTVEGNEISFILNQPRKLSIEVNGNRFNNLHLFANGIENDAPSPDAQNVHLLKPGIHRTEDILRLAAAPSAGTGVEPDILYFAPGMHYLEETVLRIPSGKTVYVAGGAVIVGSFVCERVHDVVIRGRGVLYLADFHRFSAFRGIRILFSSHIVVEGITVIDPPHYSVYLGKSEHITIRNFKSFSTRGWSDGIDMMACSDVEISDVFMRNSDDCIAIYGTRWDYSGNTSRVTVRDSILWADVAHAMNIGIHGDHHHDGDIIENIRFENIDILEHHELQVNYWGAIAINAGDKNTVRNVTYEEIRVEDFERGQLFDIRVVFNPDYNPAPGKRVEHIVFRNVSYKGRAELPSRIHGYSDLNLVHDVKFINLKINDQTIMGVNAGDFFDINEYARGITFVRGDENR